MKEKLVLNDEDLAMLELMDDIVWFGEFIRSDEEAEIDWVFDNYQKVMLNDEASYLDICTGRATGKTICLETKLIYNLVANKYRKASVNEILFVVQNKAQLEPVFLRLVKFFRTDPLLSCFVDRFSINFSLHQIRLLNGAMLTCRIVGSTADANIIGQHTPCIVVDEAQVFSYVAWNSLQQCLNEWDNECQMVISGVPNGLREKNVLYECDQMDGKFSKHNISRLQSPRYTKDQQSRDLKQYGGSEGDDYVHLVLGEHGSPSFSVFDRRLMKIENYPVTLSLVNNLSLQAAGGNYNELIPTPEPPPHKLLIAGIDAGFSNEPTIISILYMSDDNVWRIFARHELRRIKYPTQARIIDWLDTIYGFNMISLDAGSSGLALGHILQEQYESKKFIDRLILVDFQGIVVTGYKDDGSEVRERIRKFTIEQLQKWAQNDQIIVFSEQDEATISELLRVGFTRDLVGQPRYFVYSPQGGQKGDDHILASLLTWVYGYYYNYYSPEKPKTGSYSELARPGWYVSPKRFGA